ncbi:hypothetical protein A0J61_03421, partial [Choanephora cucurbitarum]
MKSLSLLAVTAAIVSVAAAESANDAAFPVFVDNVEVQDKPPVILLTTVTSVREAAPAAT